MLRERYRRDRQGRSEKRSEKVFSGDGLVSPTWLATDSDKKDWEKRDRRREIEREIVV